MVDMREEARAEADWQDCRMRLGTSGPNDLVAIARRYFMEGWSYGAAGYRKVEVTAALGYIDKSLYNVADLRDDLTWTNAEVVEVLRDVRALLSADHSCESCDDCLHDGHKCCGCYDGACCRAAALGGEQE